MTNYDRMLEKLLTKFGKPDNFTRRGTVVIETLEGESSDQADRKFSIYRWCPARDTNGLHTDCTASVVMSLDPATGVATVLYSTPLLWEFAYARVRRTTRATASTRCCTPASRRALQRACRNVRL